MWPYQLHRLSIRLTEWLCLSLAIFVSQQPALYVYVSQPYRLCQRPCHLYALQQLLHLCLSVAVNVVQRLPQRHCVVLAQWCCKWFGHAHAHTSPQCFRLR